MIEAPSQSSNSSTIADQGSVIAHEPDVRFKRTLVNVENVRLACDEISMSSETIGTTLRRMWESTGLSMRAFAARAGYATASGVQAYFDDDYDPKRLSINVAEKLAAGFQGFVDEAEIYKLTGAPPSSARPFEMEGASVQRMSHDVPIFGTALGADAVVDGEAIEQTMLNTGEVIGYLRRPVLLDGRADVYGFYVQGSSMSPRYDDGETAFAERKKPAKIGDHVVVYLRDIQDDDGERAASVLIKKLVRKTAAYIELEQYNPRVLFRIDTARVQRMDRVIPWSELVA